MRTLALTLASAFLALTLAELGLRASIEHLPRSLANYLASGYTSRGAGIYRFDPEWNMPRMRPHYRREMFFDGYRWEHRTDWMGYRNPADRTRDDIVLVGDSMVYGHGVAETDTIRSNLETLTGRSVANLGEQGAAIDYEYEILRRDAVRLHPQYAFVFFLNNDIVDLTTRLSDAEMRSFLGMALSDHSTRYFAPKRRPRDFWLADLYVVKSGLFLEKILRLDLARLHGYHRGPSSPRAAAAIDPASPSQARRIETEPAVPGWRDEEPFAGNPRMQLAMEFHLRALLKMKDFADGHGFKFAYIFISAPEPHDEVYESIIGLYCDRRGIDYFSLRPDLTKAERSGVKLYLPVDGHFTGAGARVVAEALVRRFKLDSPNSDAHP